MNTAQLRKYRAEWAPARKAMRELGWSSARCEEKRKEIHLQAGAVQKDGTPKSSLDLTDDEFTEVLGIFASWACPADFLRQAVTVNQPGIRGRWVCEDIMRMTNELSPGSYNMKSARQYLDTIWHKQNKQSTQEPDWANAASWYRVISAMTYRYDQVARARLVGKGHPAAPRKAGAKKGLEFHPSQHAKIMREYGFTPAASQPTPTPEPEPAYAGPASDGDPF